MPGTTPPPDRNTKKPSFVPPPKTCDSHCHIFGPAHKFPYDPEASYHPPDSGFEEICKLRAARRMWAKLCVIASTRKIPARGGCVSIHKRPDVH